MEETSKERAIIISPSELEICKEDVLGRGGYGLVCRGHFRNTGQIVAVKLLIAEGVLPKRNIRDLEREAKRLKQFTDHPSILNMYGVLMEPSCYGLVLEYMHFGSSAYFVKEFHVDMPLLLRITRQVIEAMAYLHSYRITVDMPLLLRITRQVIEAMAYLHSHNPPILHLDLKADNILINNYLDAKICDFGLSEWRTVTQTVTGAGRRCTITHIAPEVLLNINAPSTKALDIYAFGITLWELFTGKDVYSGRAENLVRESVVNYQRPDLKLMPLHTIQIQQIMARCWQPDEHSRPMFSTLTADIDPIYGVYERHLPAALKSVRRQICENFAVNDEEYIHTEHLDEIEVELIEESTADNNMDTSVQPESLMETDVPNTLPTVSPVTPLVLQAPVRRAMPVEGHKCSDPIQIHFNGEKRNFEPETWNAINNPIGLDMFGNQDRFTSIVYNRVNEKLASPRDLQQFVNNDTLQRSEFVRSNMPFFSAFNQQKNRHSKLQSKLWQKYGRRDDTQKFYSYNRHQNPEDMTADEKRRYDKMMDLRVCSYGKKLTVGGIGEKLIKALKEPSYLNLTIMEPDPKPGEPKRFNVIDPKVKELALDPMILQIVLSQEPEILDSLMRQYPDMVMKMLANGKTEYRPASERRHWRRHERDMSYMIRMMRRPDDRHYHGMMDYEDDDDPFSSMMGMTGSSRDRRRQEEMMKQIAADRRKKDKEEKEKQKREEQNKRDKEKQKREMEKQKREKQKIDNKKKDEEMRSEREKIKAEVEQLKQKTANELKERERERQREIHRQKVEEQKKAETEVKGPPNMLETLQRPYRELKRDNSLTSMGASAVPSMDQLSMEEDENASPQPTPAKQTKDSVKEPNVVNSEKQKVSAVPPLSSQPKSSPPRTVKQEPYVKQEPAEMPSTSQNIRRENPKAEMMEEEKMDIDANPSSPDEKNDGAVGGAKAAPVTISHTHAGGGKTQISVMGNLENLPNLQIGSKNTMVVIGSGKDEDEAPRRKRSGKKIDLQKFPEQLMNSNQVDIVAVEIGKDWKRLCRELDLSEAEIDQIHHDFYINGLYEVMYQGMQRWMQKKGRAATVRFMAKGLWSIGRDDLALKLLM